jgi:HlyD family secretion protein
VIAIGVLVAVPYYFLSRMKEPEFLLRSYTYAPVETRTFIRKLAVSGNVKPEEILTVKLESEGMLQELFVQAGDDVKEGDLIATIDTSNLRESLAEAEDALLKAQNKVNELLLNKKIQDKNNEKTIVSLEEQLNSLKETLALQEKLYEIGAISLKDLQDAENAVKKAQNELDSKPEEFRLNDEKFQFEQKAAQDALAKAEKTYKELEDKFTNTKIYAPISGRILEVEAVAGKYMQGGSNILKIADMNSSVVAMYLNENDAVYISVGQEATVRVSGSVVRGVVTFVSPQTTNVSGQGPAVEAMVKLNEVPANLRANSTASVEFELQRRDNVPYLPRGTYLTSGEYRFVFVLEGDKAVRKNVSFGQHDGDTVEVLSGLEVGDKVITSSYEEFKEKTEITVVPEGGSLH